MHDSLLELRAVYWCASLWSWQAPAASTGLRLVAASLSTSQPLQHTSTDDLSSHIKRNSCIVDRQTHITRSSMRIMTLMQRTLRLHQQLSNWVNRKGPWGIAFFCLHTHAQHQAGPYDCREGEQGGQGPPDVTGRRIWKGSHSRAISLS